MNLKSIIFTFFIFLFCWLITGLSWAGGRNEAGQFYSQGLKALEEGRHEEGISNLEKALIYSPDNENIISALSLAYNNYAVILSRQPQQLDRAIFNLEKAVELSPADIKFNHNLSDIYTQKARIFYEQDKNYEQAIKFSNKATALNPDNFLALEILGDCYYFTQDLKSALDYWQKAQELNPGSKKLEERIKKVKQEIGFESNLTRSSADCFEIRLSKTDLPFDASIIRDYLRQAYREVGQDFNYFPRHTIIVFIYTEEEFHQRYHFPEWSGGAYDGKIRLPANTKNFTESQFKGLIWHEYTHAIVRDLTQDKCPLWVNEGLAVWEGSRYDRLDLKELGNALKEGNIIPLIRLHEKFAPINQSKEIYLAYQEAYTVVSFLIEHYGFWHIQNALVKIKNQKDMDEILKSIFGLDWGQLQKKWLEHLKTSILGNKEKILSKFNIDNMFYRC